MDRPDTARDGGGLDTTLRIPLPHGGLAPGASVSIAFSFAVDLQGAYWFGYDVDALARLPRAAAPAEAAPRPGPPACPRPEPAWPPGSPRPTRAGTASCRDARRRRAGTGVSDSSPAARRRPVGECVFSLGLGPAARSRPGCLARLAAGRILPLPSDPATLLALAACPVDLGRRAEARMDETVDLMLQTLPPAGRAQGSARTSSSPASAHPVRKLATSRAASAGASPKALTRTAVS